MFAITSELAMYNYNLYDAFAYPSVPNNVIHIKIPCPLHWGQICYVQNWFCVAEVAIQKLFSLTFRILFSLVDSKVAVLL